MLRPVGRLVLDVSGWQESQGRGISIESDSFCAGGRRRISRLVQYHLEAAGFTVRPYLTLGAIVADAERQPPAVFLLDIMVPGGDGLDLCRQAAQESGAEHGADHLSDGAGGGERPRDGPGAGRGRLHHQAVWDARTGGAGEGGAAAVRAADCAFAW